MNGTTEASRRKIPSTIHTLSLLAALLALPVACAEPSEEELEQLEVANNVVAITSLEIPTLETLIAEYVEIDRLDENARDVGDANLFVGPDPSPDASPSREFPPCPEGQECTFIDWDYLCQNDKVNHLLPDDAVTDGTMFPTKSECVGTGNVLAKMDLTYIAAANNMDYAYFAVQRRNNNGDAGYYWLFTRLEPSCEPDLDVCAPDQCRLMYDISGPAGDATGDVLIAGQFHPSTGVVVRVFQAQQDSLATPAGAAIEYTNTALWKEVVVDGIEGAVNLTTAAPGACGAEKIDRQAMVGANVEPEIFAEASVPLSIFTGGGFCGAQFYGSVITRPSGSGGTNPDLKDLAGPAVFNFGNVSAEASMAPSCEHRTFSHQLDTLSGPGVDGVEGAVCEWTFTYKGDAADCASVAENSPSFTSSDCADEAAELPEGLPEGVYCASVFVTASEGNLSCNTTADAGEVGIYDALDGTASVEPSCEHRQFSYALDSLSGQGVSGPDDGTCHWTFTHKGDAADCASVEEGSPSFSTVACSDEEATLPEGLPEGRYCASVTVQAVGSAGVCEAIIDAGEVDIFNGLQATGAVEPTCEPRLYSFELVSITGQGVGEPGEGICDWTFTHKGDAADCASAVGESFTVTGSCADPEALIPESKPVGTYCASFTVTAGALDCSVSVLAGEFTAWDEIIISDATVTGGCDNTLEVFSVVTGGSGSYTLAWACTGGLSSSASAHTFSGLDPGYYFCQLDVTDNRQDVSGEGYACERTMPSAGDNVASPLSVHLTPSDQALACVPGVLFHDAVTYTASPAGGSAAPSYVFNWSQDSCDGATSCTVEPESDAMCPSIQLFATLSDSSETRCTADDSEFEYYTKKIEVNATDN